MCGDKSARIIIKTGSGVPTIPVSADHRNGDWIATDIYEGESYMDTDTGIVYTRNGSSIEAVGGGGGTTNVFATKVINIGPWDMDTDAAVNVAHGISDFTKIVSVYVIILSDTLLNRSNLSSIITTSGVINGGVGQIDSVNISLERTDGGSFDTPSYNDGAMNRGFITITYEL